MARWRGSFCRAFGRERVHRLPIGSRVTARLGLTFAALDDDQRAEDDLTQEVQRRLAARNP